MLRHLALIILILSSFTSAAAQYCGRDSLLTCPTLDSDGDGYTTTGVGLGYDCDDNNWQIVPGVWRFNGGQYSFCQSNGTWSTGTAVPVASSGSGQTFFVDCDAVTNGSGTHASPWNTLRMVATMSGANTPVGWRNLVAGDAVFIAGTCDEEIDHDTNPANDSYNFVISGEIATPANPIKFISWPNRVRGHFKSLVYKSKIVEVLGGSQYIEFWGLELSGLGDYGLSFADSANLTARTMYIHDVDGVITNNNSGMAFTLTTGSNVTHSLFLNNYDRAVLTGGATQNLRHIVLFQGTGNVVNYNVLKYTNAEILNAEYGAGIGYKHGSTALTTNSVFSAFNNVVIGSAFMIETGAAGSNIFNNYGEYRDACLSYRDVGGPYYPNNLLF